MKKYLVLLLMICLIPSLAHSQIWEDGLGGSGGGGGGGSSDAPVASSRPYYYAARHNRVNTCKNLLESHTLAELSAMIYAGTFDDIYVGDYIEVEMTTTTTVGYDTETNPGTPISGTVTEKVRWIVASIDYFYHKGNPDINTHHVVMVAEDCLKTRHRINDGNSFNLAWSEIYTTILPQYNSALSTALGAMHILSYPQYLGRNENTSMLSMAGASMTVGLTSAVWADGQSGNPALTGLMLMSEPQLYGGKVLSSSYFDIGMNQNRFELFSQIPNLVVAGRGFNKSESTRESYWLSGVAGKVVGSSGRMFSCCSAEGLASYNWDYYTNTIGLRPYFLFK